jgi:hypothetical protein
LLTNVFFLWRRHVSQFDIVTYADLTDQSIFNLDDSCPVDTVCVGRVLTFKSPLYDGPLLDNGAEIIGDWLGTCTFVSTDPINTAYCTITTVFADEGEIALQGFARVGTAGEYLITAASDDYEGETGTMKTMVMDEGTKIRLGFKFD